MEASLHARLRLDASFAGWENGDGIGNTRYEQSANKDTHLFIFSFWPKIELHLKEEIFMLACVFERGCSGQELSTVLILILLVFAMVFKLLKK